MCPFIRATQPWVALRTTALIEDYGREVARQLRELGVRVNFAPVADVNTNR